MSKGKCTWEKINRKEFDKLHTERSYLIKPT